MSNEEEILRAWTDADLYGEGQILMIDPKEYDTLQSELTAYREMCEKLERTLKECTAIKEPTPDETFQRINYFASIMLAEYEKFKKERE